MTEKAILLAAAVQMYIASKGGAIQAIENPRAHGATEALTIERNEITNYYTRLKEMLGQQT